VSYTKGPWKWDRLWLEGFEDRTVLSIGNGYDGMYGGDEPSEEDAHLIAAAPELLEALQGIIDIGKRDLTNPKYDGYFESARAAIAKAKGEGK
jgi:hypothetical protein